MHDPKALRGIESKAIHAGEYPDPVTGASAPNLVMSTTFVTDEPAGFSAHDLSDDSPFLYSRWGNPTVRQLEAKIAALEGAESAVCTASGMAAGSGLLLTLLSAGDRLVVSNTNYAGVAELVRDTLPRMGIEVAVVDTSDLDEVERALKAKKTKLVYIETPANPIMRLADVAAIAELAHQHGASLGVDSTFASPVATRPIELGADYVVQSLTKYYCGHGDAVGGAIAGTSESMRAINFEAGIHFGGVLSPFNAWMILRGTATLPLRMRAHEQNALELSGYLQNHPAVTAVMYPGLESHPQHALARRQMQNFSGMLTFQVADGSKVAERAAKELQIFHYAVSLGHHRSLIFWMPTEDLMSTSFRLSGDDLKGYREFAGDGIFRVSVGLETAQDLCADLDHILN